MNLMKMIENAVKHSNEAEKRKEAQGGTRRKIKEEKVINQGSFRKNLDPDQSPSKDMRTISREEMEKNAKECFKKRGIEME